MKKLYFSLFFLISFFSFGQIVINEVDVNQDGTDTAEFIELLWTPNTSLDSYVVVLFDGNDDQSYTAYDLDGKSTDADGFFILANTSLALATDVDLGADSTLQNGADAVAVYQADATDFPNDTPLTMTNLIDAVVYDTNQGDDTVLLSGLGETVQYNENENGNSATESVQRKSDGSYETKSPTFRKINNAVTCSLTVSNPNATCDDNTQDNDAYTATLDFSGGGTATYTVTSDFGELDLSNGDPTNDATGTIIITGLIENTDVVVTITDSVADGNLCNLMQTISSPVCNPSVVLPFEETFNYTAGTNLVDDGKWNNTSTSSDEVLVKSGNLSYTGLKASVGNSISFDGVGSDPEVLFDPVLNGIVYASFIFKVADQTAVQDFIVGGYFAIIGSTATGFDSRLWVRANPDNASTQFDIGLGNTGFDDVTTTLYDIGDEIFIVLSYNITTGVINAWINPSPGDFGGTEPASTLTATDGSPSPSLNRFIIRQDSTNETPSIEMDELRIANSWADVTPAGAVASVNRNEIEGFSIYPNPVSDGVLRINTLQNSEKTIEIFDILGKKVLSRTITSQHLLISRLNSGIYIIKVSEQGKTATRKLVVK